MAVRTPIVLVNGVRKPLPDGDTIAGLATTNDVTAMTSGLAPTAHNHDGIYAAEGHTHAGYATTSHTHAGIYEPANANIQSHIGSAHAPANAQANADITKAEIEAKLTGVIASHSHAGGASPFQIASISADVTNSNAVANTLADVTGLQFPVTAGQRYWFRFVISYTAAATTTGSRWTINGPAITELRYKSEYTLTATTQTINEGLNAYNLPAASNATSIVAANLAVIEGFILPSANGNVIARFASEVLSSAIVARRGAMVQYAAVG